MPITALYTALLTLLFITLSLRVISVRRQARTALGDGGNPELLRRIRVQANCAEYAPLGLILLGLSESLHTPAWLVHAVGLALLVGRLSHAFGVSRSNEAFVFRVAGMALTFTALAMGALICLYGFATRGF